MPENEPKASPDSGPNAGSLTPADLGRFGQKHVGSWLHVSGYVVKQVNELPGLTEIEADHPTSKMLVHVRTSLMPAAPKDLSPEEFNNLKSRALEAGRKPYAAKVRVDHKGRLIGGVKWQNVG